jgi:hypothetical protein
MSQLLLLTANSRFGEVSYVNMTAQCSTLHASERYVLIRWFRNAGNQKQRYTTAHQLTPHHNPPDQSTTHHITPHHTKPHHPTKQQSTPHHKTSHHKTHHTTPRHTTSQHTTTHHPTPHHTVPHNNTPHHNTQIQTQIQSLNPHITMLLPNTISTLRYQWSYLTRQQHKMWCSYGHCRYKVTGRLTPLFLFKLLSVLLSSFPYQHSLSTDCTWMVESLNNRNWESFRMSRLWCNGDYLPVASTWRE